MEELLRTGLTLIDTLSTLLEDEKAFPEEEGGEVLIEMLVGTCRPVIEAAGMEQCRSSTALLTAIRDRFIEDLRLAASLAKPVH